MGEEEHDIVLQKVQESKVRQTVHVQNPTQNVVGAVKEEKSHNVCTECHFHEQPPVLKKLGCWQNI